VDVRICTLCVAFWKSSILGRVYFEVSAARAEVSVSNNTQCATAMSHSAAEVIRRRYAIWSRWAAGTKELGRWRQSGYYFFNHE